MFSKTFIKSLGLRIWLMAVGSGTPYNWDKSKERLVRPNFYEILGLYQGNIGGYSFTTVLLISVIMRITKDDIPEEQTEDSESHESRLEFATTMIGFGEVLLLYCVTNLVFVILKRRDDFMLLINELINYAKTMKEMTEEGKLKLTKNHKVLFHVVEIMAQLVMWGSLVLPYLILVAVMHPIDPTNALIKEWFEIEYGFNYQSIPFMVLMVAGIHGAGSIVCLMTVGITLYYAITVVATEAFMPEKLGKVFRGRRCQVETRCFGSLDDIEVIKLYRMQQILNVLLTKVFASIMVSFHHVAVIATVVVLACFAIRFHDVITAEGPTAWGIIISCLFAPLALMFFQSREAGDVVDVSEAFKVAGHDIVPRKFLFAKFVKSCQTFYIQVTYPYYSIHKETFLMFCEVSLDHIITLLLW